MKKDELENMLHQLRDHEKQAYFCIKKSEEEPEGGLWIEANRNGAIVFCGFLLKSIDRKHLEKQSVYEIPDAFNDDSDIGIHYIRIEEGNKNPELKGDMLTQVGCGIVIVACALIFIAGLVSTFQWITKLIE
jgi:hypothetical protein